MPRKFGVELEIGAYELEDIGKGVVTRVSETSFDYETRRYIFKKEKVLELPKDWVCEVDGSCGSEFVSPPLLETTSIFEMCKALDDAEAGGFTYGMKNTGMHVHVDATGWTVHDAIEVAAFCRHFDRTIFSFVNRRRIRNEYCRPVAANNDTLFWRFQDNHKWDARYHGCNIKALEKHGTIEFRYSEGTFDAYKIQALVDLFVHIVEWCNSNKGKRIDSPKRNLEGKRRFLLDLVGVSESTKQKLLASSWKQQV